MIWKVSHLNREWFPDTKVPELPEGTQIRLIHKDDWNLIISQTGRRLYCIDGTSVIVGTDVIDNDHRGGWLAYGDLISDNKGEQTSV